MIVLFSYLGSVSILQLVILGDLVIQLADFCLHDVEVSHLFTQGAASQRSGRETISFQSDGCAFLAQRVDGSLIGQKLFTMNNLLGL